MATKNEKPTPSFWWSIAPNWISAIAAVAALLVGLHINSGLLFVNSNVVQLTNQVVQLTTHINQITGSNVSGTAPIISGNLMYGNGGDAIHIVPSQPSPPPPAAH
jgi:hypothetical protein